MNGTWWKRIEPQLWFFVSLDADPTRELYAALLGALLIASTRTPMATLSDVRGLLDDIGYRDPITDADLLDALDKLAKRDLVHSTRDYTAAVTDWNDALRRQEAWALTKHGRVVVQAVRDAIRNLGRSMRLPPRLLDAVEETIHQLLDHLHDNPAMLDQDLARVRGHLEELQTATGDFYAAVAALVQHDVTDDTVFVDNREKILLALQQFVRQTERSLERVRKALTELDQAGHASIVEQALPGAGLLDDESKQTWADEMRQRLEDLNAWFTPRGSIARLIDSATGAIHTLLGAIERRFHAVTRGSDLGADFRQLARMLHAQPSEPAAHQLFAAAFGLWPARHPQRPEVEDISAMVTAEEGGTYRISVTLRPTERGEQSTGRPRKIPDLTDERAAAEAEAMVEQQRMVKVLQDLLTPGVVSLTYFAGLDQDHSAVLIPLLEEAWDHLDQAAGTGIAKPPWEPQCELELRPGKPGRIVTVPFAEGTLIAPEMYVQIRLLDQETAEGQVA